MKNMERETSGEVNRRGIIIRTSVVGIVVNILLAAFKALVGILSNSIAITLDAVNNFSDAASSIITIVGTHLAGKAPDKKHPYGHGRVEYLTAMVIAVIVLYAGTTSFVESVRKIIDPVTPEYSTLTLAIIVVAVVTKIILGQYVKKKGEEVNSASLVNSGEDARLDAVISAATVVAAILYMQFGISLEAILGAIISLVIIKSGIEMLRETVSELLGERVDKETVLGIKRTVMQFPEVKGVYDLVLNNYGPDTFNGSLHIEIPDTLTVNEVDDLLRQIQVAVYQEHQVLLTAIGVYSMNTTDEHIITLRKKIKDVVLEVPYVLQMHGFYVHEEKKVIRFDAVISFDSPNRNETFQQILDAVQEVLPEYQYQIAADFDFSET